MDLTGQQLGKYRLKSILGIGGFATVYLGTHVILQRDAAIKVLKEIVLNEEDLAGFLTEARVISNLIHPNIIKVLDANIEMQKGHGDGSIPYLVMDYAQQGSLRKRHERNTTVAFKQIAFYVEQLALALDYAHKQDVLHLDVKPENVLVMSSGNIVLSDFGIAVTGHDSNKPLLKKDDVVVGTALYTAPERYNQTARRACDQYSLAVVVYEWLTGRCPFVGTVNQIIAEHIGKLPPPLYGTYDHITKEINDVVLRALAKDPAARYPSILDFSQALIHALLSAPEDVTIRSPINDQLKPAPPVHPVQITPPQFVPGQVAPSPRPDPIAVPQFVPGQVAPSPRPDPMAVPQFIPGQVAPSPRPSPETPPPPAQIHPVQRPMTLPPTSTQQAGSYESYTARNPFPEPGFRSRRPREEDEEKPSAIIQALFLARSSRQLEIGLGISFMANMLICRKGDFSDKLAWYSTSFRQFC